MNSEGKKKTLMESLIELVAKHIAQRIRNDTEQKNNDSGEASKPIRHKRQRRPRNRKFKG